MSTPETAPASTGSQHEDETIKSSLALPTFAPIREPVERRMSHAESSNSSSRKSALDFQRRSRSSLRESLSIRGSDGTDNHDTSTTSSRWLKKRNSGGFLLDTAAKPLRASNSLRSQRDLKGKRKSEDSEISIPKRRNRASILDHDTSIGSSPLAMEVRQEDDIQSSHEAELGRVQNNTNGQHTGNAMGARSSRPNTKSSIVPAVGYDTDPAQIVDMALRLSEGRRRHASNKRYISGGSDGRRIVSTSTNYTRSVTPTKTLGQYLSSTPPSGTAARDLAHIGNMETTAEDPHSPQTYGHYHEKENVLEISRATASRVEKARTYLELAYEHRRLLAHLPPIRKPDQAFSSIEPMPESRVYNPLQYVRNRKLRLREKSAISGEVEGWHDVEKVRTWVDTVVNSHTETKHDPLECVRLPPLTDKSHTPDIERTQMQGGLIPLGQQGARPRRPKSDWVTHPGDIIADAHWLEQGLNKTKIQDRDNNQIYPPHTQFKFSGWRNATPIRLPDGLQEQTPPSEDEHLRDAATPPLESAPALPTFRSTYQKKNKKDRRQVSTRKIRKSIAQENHQPRRKLSGKSGNMDGEVDSATSSDNDGINHKRGRKRTIGKADRFDLENGDPFGHSVASKKDDKRNDQPTNASDPNLSAAGSKRLSLDQNKLISYLKRNSTRRGFSSDREDSTKQGRPRSERDIRTSFDNDSTAPTSPMTERWPSIAINLSPPHSRSPSPVKRGKSSILHTLLDRNHSQSREQIDSTDFALPKTITHSREPSTESDTRQDSSHHHSRGTSPRTRGPSPLTKLSRAATAQDDISQPTPLEQRSTTMSRMSTRSGTNPGEHGRIRGIFKGGRIAELVGNEVTRVGDFIWKREPPAAGVNSDPYNHSDTDEELVQNGTISRTPTRDGRPPTRDGRSPASTHSSPRENRLSQDSSKTGETPQYHNPNLPSFTSPFQKDRDKQSQKRDHLSPDTALGGDHISQAAADHRSRSKSPRMDRLAPPKLVIDKVQTADPALRRGSYGFGAALDLAKPRAASQTFNAMMGGPTEIDRSRSSSRANFDRHLHRNISGADKRSVTKQDVSRIEALLIMSAVKAKGLVTVQEAIPPMPSKFLTANVKPDADNIEKSEPPRVRRREEHVLAARNIISILGEQSNKIHEELSTFSGTTIANLQKELQAFEDTIENTLTPRVRAAADNAGELSQKLTTTSTMAVKGVNDMISEAFRMRQRGPFRFLRKLGYGAIEWAVVGLLWLIWFVVMIVRFGLNVIRGSVRIGRWLVWLD